jgi:hypothetical protein
VNWTEGHVFRSDLCWIEAGFTIRLAFHISLKIRTVMYFLWLKDFPNAEIHREIDFVYEEGVIWPRDIRNWTHHFAEGDYSLEDRLRTDRLRSIEYMDAICALLADDLYLPQKRIASILNIHQDTVKRILRQELWLRNVNCK